MKYLTSRSHRLPPPLLLLTLALSVHAVAAQQLAGQQVPSTDNTPLPNTSPSVIGGLLREQLSRREPPAPQAAPTTTTVSSASNTSPQRAIETKVPSTIPQAAAAATITTTSSTTVAAASQQPASQAQATTTTTTTGQSSPTQQAQQQQQFQVLRPHTLAQPQSIRPANVPETTATSIISTTTTSTTTSTTQRPEVAPAPPPVACQHNNQTYQIGQKWNDDCLQVCECVQGAQADLAPLAISACRPRCPIYKDPPGDRCKLIRSKTDECCLEWSCELEGKFAPTSPISPTTLITTTQTERGQLNMSTTEIRMPSSVDSTSPSTLAAITTTPTTTTNTTTITTPKPATTRLPLTTTTTAQPVTTTQRRASSRPLVPNTAATTTTTTTQRSSVSSSSNPPQPTTTTTTSSTTTSVSARRPPIQQPTGGAQSGRDPRRMSATGQPVGAPSSAPGRRGATEQNFAPSLPDQDLRSLARFQSDEFPDVVPPMPTTATTTTSTTSSTATANVGQPDVELNAGDNTNEPEVNPNEHHLCIISPTQAYRINQSWFDDCDRPCRCVFRDEMRVPARDVSVELTVNLRNVSMPSEIRCGWPQRCSALPKQLTPSAACPEPHLFLAQGSASLASNKCACPELRCGLVPMSSTTPLPVGAVEPVPSSIVPADTPASLGCKWRNGKLLAPGQSFNDECHSTCRCSTDGEIRCEPLACPSELPTATPQCLEWQSDPNFLANSSQNKCCAEFVCKTPAPTPTSSSSTASSPSSSEPDEQPTGGGGGDEEELRELKSCLLLGKELPHGERVPEEIQPRSSGSTSASATVDAVCENVCSCQDGKIVCQPPCPAIGELPPDDLECSAALAYLVTDGCCPRWTCQIKENYALQDLHVQLLNASTVELLISLPQFAVKQRGRFELNYTSLPVDNADSLADEPPAYARWQRRPSIKTQNGVFPDKQIKYYWPDLKPNHKYWFKLLVRFDGLESVAPFDGPIESALQTFVMPAPAAGQPPTSTSTSTTTTTPISTVPISATSVSRNTPTTHASKHDHDGNGDVATTSSSTTPASVTRPQPTITVTSPPTRILQPASKQPAITMPAPTRQTTTTGPPSESTTSSTTTSTPRPSRLNPVGHEHDIIKPELSQPGELATTPCQHSHQTQKPATTTATNSVPTFGRELGNQIDDLPHANPLDILAPSSWSEQLQQQVHSSIQRNAWHLLVAFFVMTILFVVVLYSYCKKVRVVASITTPAHHHHNGHHLGHHHHHQSAYDNPTFTKLVSYYANQPHVLLVDENNQNFDNMAKQKNLEVDKSSPLHNNNNNNNNNNNSPANNNHHTTPVHHPNGRQHLI